MLRRSAALAGALLAGFHLWLLGTQAWSGQLADADVGFRWLAAAVLAAGLLALRRRGVSLIVGRQAVAIWVLAALLHGPALAGGLESPAMPEAVTTAFQALAAVFGLGLAALAAARFLIVARRPGSAPMRAAQPIREFSASTQLRFLPRPPPLA